MTEKTQRPFRSRLLWLSGFLLVFGFLTVLALPLYWGTLLGLILRSNNITYSSYERIGSSRFTLQGVEMTLDQESATIAIHCDQMIAPMPFSFALGRDRDLHLIGWEVNYDAEDISTPPATETDSSLPEITNQVVEYYKTGRPYINSLELREGRLTISECSIQFTEILLQSDNLSIQGTVNPQAIPFKIDTTLVDLTKIPLNISLLEQAVDIALKLRPDTNNLNIEGEIRYENQPITLRGVWDTDGLAPDSFICEADTLKIKAPWLTPYSLDESVIASLSFEWADGGWNATAKGEAAAQAAGESLGLNLSAQLSGNTESVTVSELEVSSSGLNAQLESELKMNIRELTIPKEAVFSFSGSLADQPFLPLQGTVEGKLRFAPTEEQTYPKVQLELSGNGIRYDRFESDTLVIDAQLDWPLLTIRSAELIADSAIQLEMKGGIHLENRAFESLSVDVLLTSAWVQQFLNDSPDFEKAEASLRLQGAWLKPQHTAALSIKGIREDTLGTGDIQLNWDALGTSFHNLDFNAAFPDKYAAVIKGNGSLAYSSGEALAFNLVGKSTGEINQNETLALSYECMADAKGIALKTLKLQQDTVAVFEASGIFPVGIHPATNEPIRLLAPDASFSFDLHTSQHGQALEKLFASGEWDVIEPSVELQLKGPLSSLIGHTHITAKKLIPLSSILSAQKFNSKVPIENLNARLSFNENGITLENFQVLVFEKQIQSTAFLPMSEQNWKDLIEHRTLPDLSTATGKLNSEAFPLATLGHALPPMLRPEGTVSGSLTLEPKFHLSGELHLSKAATRPIAPFGALAQIEAHLKVDNRTLTIQDLSAKISDKPVTISGKVDLTEPANPRLDIKLIGDSLPLLRSSGIVLRGNPNLHIITSTNGQTRIEGRLQLKDSILTIDLADLAPNLSGVSTTVSAATRFPYFSITEAPFREWVLDVGIEGDSFMNVRTPGFTGQISADYHIGGTLEEPIAVGHLTVPQGVIRFPFASFKVSEAMVGTSQEEPFEPTLKVAANGKAYGYKITMEATGSISDPQVTFTSNPSLDTQAIILLITSGQIPNPEFTKSTGQRLSGIGLYLSKGLLADLGLIDPSEDRLQIRLGENISRTGRDTVEVEYKLSEKWSAQGDYDQFDSYNLDLKWKVFEK